MKRKLKVLIVDDESAIIEIISETLAAEGCITFSASSGNSAIKILHEEIFDIIISDFRMQDGNGLDLLTHVKNLKQKPVFIFMSGYSDLSPEECIKAGADEFFHKPFILEELTSLILDRYHNANRLYLSS